MARTWTGNEALAGMLVPLGSLAPHPRNPRQGDVERIRSSLRRFGQQRPLLCLPDGTLVAGHHVWRAARAEGWTHIAAVRSDLAEREVEAYLLADNRLADIGSYDDPLLAELLAELQAGDLLEGTGYEARDLDELLAKLQALDAAAPGDFGLPNIDPAFEQMTFTLTHEEAATVAEALVRARAAEPPPASVNSNGWALAVLARAFVARAAA